MSDPHTQPQKKKNKKKKKPTANANSVPPPPTAACQNGSDKEFSINEVLPQKVGMTTVFKDVEVTMTHCGDTNPTTNGVSKKKKKKKKKSKLPTPEKTEEPVANEAETPNSFFKFNEDHIELVNHPEISVTLSTPLESESKPSPVSKEVPVISEQKEQPSVPVAATSSKKKKKKKKKSNNCVESKVPPEPVPESTDSYTAPTYIKLPASGDNCVLLVSHESFSNDSKTVENNTGQESQNSTRVLVKSKERIEESKDISQVSSKIQSGNSVSIFPVTKESKIETDTGEINMDSSLKKVSNLIKMEEKAIESSGLNSENGAATNEESKLTKAQLKAERRAKQEAQRAAKLAKSNEKDVSNSQMQSQAVTKKASPVLKESPSIKQIVSENAESSASKSTARPIKKEVIRKVQVFSHLPQYKDIFAKQLDEATLKFHPSILELGSHYSKGILCGSNARCVGFLGAFRDVIRDFKTPPNKEFSKELEVKLQIYLNFLNSCRPLSVSITNAVKFLKHQINHFPKSIDDVKAKEELCLSINNFVKEEILLAKEAICISASAKIVDGDNILIFAYSSLVRDVLCEAHVQNKTFHVLVVDSRPKREGLNMLQSLVSRGLQCSYVSINAASYVLRKVSKVIIGAHALLLNGCVMSRLGCKQLALIAASYSLPVMVCCETYKFCERALTDSFVHNELGDPDDLVKISLNRNESLSNWQSLSSLQIYNILYDVTPSDLISVVITEKGLLPCTSVPVVLRVKHAGL